MSKQQIETTTVLELRVIPGPCIIQCRDKTFKLDSHDDAACLVLVTTCGRQHMSEEIVAVTTDSLAFLRLRAFALADGAITVHGNLK